MLYNPENNSISGKKGRVNMCQAIEELIEDGKKEGKTE